VVPLLNLPPTAPLTSLLQVFSFHQSEDDIEIHQTGHYLSTIEECCMDKQISKKIKAVADIQVRAKIKEIIGQVKCPKDFKCAHSGFEKLCVARDCGMDHYLECLEDNPLICKFVIVFGDRYFCQCPLRVYIAKHIEK
jgi:hypothetical protein